MLSLCRTFFSKVETKLLWHLQCYLNKNFEIPENVWQVIPVSSCYIITPRNRSRVFFKKTTKTQFKLIVLSKHTQKHILRKNNEMLIKPNFPYLHISPSQHLEKNVSQSDVCRYLPNLYLECLDYACFYICAPSA